MLKNERTYRLNVYIKLIIAIMCLLILRGNIVCKDGTISPSCKDCHQGCCSHHGGCSNSSNFNKNKYNNYYNNTNGNSENNSDSDFTVWAIILVLGIPIVYAIFKENLNQSNSSNQINQKSEYEIFCEEVDKSKIDDSNEILVNDSRIKYSKISFKYNDQKIIGMFYSKNEVDAYRSRNSHKVQFTTIGRKVTIKNMSKNNSAYLLYQYGVFDYHMCATFYTYNINIYDLNKTIRRLYDFKSKKLLTRNLARAKKKITSGEQYEFKIVIKDINYSRRLEIEMNLNELIEFSKLCQSIEIIEK